MVYLKKEEVFFERDENGNLLPVDVTLETLPDKPTIKAIPLSKGELTKLASEVSSDTETDKDIDIVIKYCKEPKFTEADREALKTAGKIHITNAISLAIISLSSNVSQEELLKKGKQTMINKELQDFQ